MFSIVVVAKESVFKWQKISENISEESRKMLFGSKIGKKLQRGTLFRPFPSLLAQEHLLHSYVPDTMLMSLDQFVCSLNLT